MTVGEWLKKDLDNETLASMILHTTMSGCNKCIARDICYKMSDKTCLQTLTQKLNEEYQGD